MFSLSRVLLDAAIDAKGLAGLGAGLAIGLGALGTTIGIFLISCNTISIFHIPPPKVLQDSRKCTVSFRHCF